MPSHSTNIITSNATNISIVTNIIMSNRDEQHVYFFALSLLLQTKCCDYSIYVQGNAGLQEPDSIAFCHTFCHVSKAVWASWSCLHSPLMFPHTRQFGTSLLRRVRGVRLCTECVAWEQRNFTCSADFRLCTECVAWDQRSFTSSVHFRSSCPKLRTTKQVSGSARPRIGGRDTKCNHRTQAIFVGRNNRRTKDNALCVKAGSIYTLLCSSAMLFASLWSLPFPWQCKPCIADFDIHGICCLPIMSCRSGLYRAAAHIWCRCTMRRHAQCILSHGMSCTPSASLVFACYYAHSRTSNLWETKFCKHHISL